LKNKILILCIYVLFHSCEPDDICLDAIDDTPKILIGFYDKDSKTKKEVNNLMIQGIDNDEIYLIQTLDSVAIPLKNLENLSSYNLVKDFTENENSSGNNDKLFINYDFTYKYISRACGYITNYELKNLVIENDNNNWILETEIIIPNITDEENIHVKIFH
jgi:hypothetical protein